MNRDFGMHDLDSFNVKEHDCLIHSWERMCVVVPKDEPNKEPTIVYSVYEGMDKMTILKQGTMVECKGFVQGWTARQKLEVGIHPASSVAVRGKNTLFSLSCILGVCLNWEEVVRLFPSCSDFYNEILKIYSDDRYFARYKVLEESAASFKVFKTIQEAISKGYDVPDSYKEYYNLYLRRLEDIALDALYKMEEDILNNGKETVEKDSK